MQRCYTLSLRSKSTHTIIQPYIGKTIKMERNVLCYERENYAGWVLKLSLTSYFWPCLNWRYMFIKWGMNDSICCDLHVVHLVTMLETRRRKKCIVANNVLHDEQIVHEEWETARWIMMVGRKWKDCGRSCKSLRGGIDWMMAVKRAAWR